MKALATLLVALVLSGCAMVGPASGPMCTGDVTVHVISQTVSEVDVQFGNENRRRRIDGFQKERWQVNRAYLRDPIRLRISKGGMNRPDTPPVLTQSACSDATLIIMDPLRYSHFYAAKPLGGPR